MVLPGESALFNPLPEFASSWRHCGPRNKSGNPRHVGHNPPRLIGGEVWTAETKQLPLP